MTDDDVVVVVMCYPLVCPQESSDFGLAITIANRASVKHGRIIICCKLGKPAARGGV